jgi:hypothetical protein
MVHLKAVIKIFSRAQQLFASPYFKLNADDFGFRLAIQK